jgi:hypothetical protein
MPSPRFLRSETCPVTFPEMAFDEAPKFPRAALPSARGGEAGDQNDPDNNNITIANSPAHAAMLKLCKFLADRLPPDDMSEVQDMLQDLFGSTSNGGGDAMAGDRRPRIAESYEQRFPNQGRLYRKTF